MDSYTLVGMLKHPLVEDEVNDGGKGGRGKVSMIILHEQLYSWKEMTRLAKTKQSFERWNIRQLSVHAMSLMKGVGLVV